MKIAVMNAQMSGDTSEFDESKWAKMTADLIQHNLEQAAEHNNIPIKLVDREHMKLTMGEKDLAAAGVTVPPIAQPNAPAPLALASGTQPRIKAKLVIRIGRNLSLAPSSAASRRGLP